MRTVLAAAAAGALVLGSAGAATAGPGKAKKAGKQEYMQLRMVDVHNGFLNVHPDAKHRDIKVKALVRDTVKASDPTDVSVVLAHYAAKGKPADPALIEDVTVKLELKSKIGKKTQKYRAVVEGDDLALALAAVLPVGATTYVCLKDATLAGDSVKDPAKQVAKKIKRGRDCFRVVNMAPDLTKSTSDDVS
jgi:hypothetical protein